MDHWVMPSGALVSMEAVDRRPQPWDVGYEYCTIFEREFTLLSAVRETRRRRLRRRGGASLVQRRPGLPGSGRHRGALLFRGKPPVGQ